MPHIAVTMYAGRHEDAKREIAQNLQAELMKTLNAPANYISVSIEEVEPADWDKTIAEKVDHKDLLIPSDFVK